MNEQWFTLRRYSTLEQALERTGRCVAVSEPNSPSFVSFKYRKFGDSSELRQLARDVIRWECRPYPTMQPAPLGYLLKLTAPCAVVLPMFRLVMTRYQDFIFDTMSIRY